LCVYSGVFEDVPSNDAYRIFRPLIFVAMTTKFEDVPSNAANRIFRRSTPVAMATKFVTKLAITRSV